MVILNGFSYDIYKLEVTYGNFSNTKYENGFKKIIKGEAPYISLKLQNNITICIETIYSKELLKETKINVDLDITKYVTDILYKSGVDNNWKIIIDGLKSCHIKRLDDVNYNINVSVNYNNEEIELKIDSKIKLL